jgi:hypothetical protein
MAPQVQNSLLSTSKVVEADYIAIYDKEEVNFYNAKTTKITVLEEAVLKGWQCPATGLWQFPLVENPVNLNTNTLLLDHPTVLQSQNQLYTLQTPKRSRKHIQAFLSCTNKEEYIHNVYELPSIEWTVWYQHAAAGHPLEDTWAKAVGRGNYSSWPLINTKNVRKYFLELKETQLGHMQGQQQGVQSTRPKQPVNTSPDPSIKKKHNIYVHIYKLKQEDCLMATIYADQTGDFLYISSQGNKSIMLLHHINSNSFWVELLKNQTEGLLIATQTQALEKMGKQGIVPKHPILDNQCSTRMKLAMESTTLSDRLVSKMMYKLVPQPSKELSQKVD